jgi:hypothetical protein
MRLAVFYIVLVALIAIGCTADDGRVKVYPVRGKVLVKGQPAQGARVVFYAAAADAAAKKLPTPAGETDASGQYRLQSYEPEDGAPVGGYNVSVTWLEPPPPNAQGIFDQKDRLGGRYSNPNKSGLTAHVEKGGGEISPFELQ